MALTDVCNYMCTYTYEYIQWLTHTFKYELQNVHIYTETLCSSYCNTPSLYINQGCFLEHCECDS